MLIQVFISVRSERQLVEQIRSSFSKNRDRLLEHRVVENFFARIKRNRCANTRYDRLAEAFMAFVNLAALADWIRF